MSDRDITHLHPDLQPLYTQWHDMCHRQSIPVFMVEGFRSMAQQALDYAVGRDEHGNIIGKILTNAKPGQSPHNFTIDGNPASKAFDWAILNPDGSVNWNANSPLWKTAVTIGKLLTLKWGGDFSWKDNDHFELENNRFALQPWRTQ